MENILSYYDLEYMLKKRKVDFYSDEADGTNSIR